MQWDSAKFRANRNQQLLRWFNGDVSAVDCFLMISNAAEVWDDIKDGDPLSEQDTDTAFIDMMIRLNENAFFLSNREKILGGLIITMNSWMDANIMAASRDKDDRIKAYVLRNLGLELVPMFVYISQGHTKARSYSMEIRKYFTHETFEDWEKEHELS